jgi:hypothetical protein
LNGENFAGRDDWRVPNRFEIETLLNLGTSSPATYPVFDDNCNPGCTVTDSSCTRNALYWSSTTYNASQYPWFVNFSVGDVSNQQKIEQAAVRAVRKIP